MSHEKTITVEIDGQHIILPTVVDGKDVTPDESVNMFRRGRINPLGVYPTQEEADKAARKRSRSFGEHR